MHGWTLISLVATLATPRCLSVFFLYTLPLFVFRSSFFPSVVPVILFSLHLWWDASALSHLFACIQSVVRSAWLSCIHLVVCRSFSFLVSSLWDVGSTYQRLVVKQRQTVAYTCGRKRKQTHHRKQHTKQTSPLRTNATTFAVLESMCVCCRQRAWRCFDLLDLLFSSQASKYKRIRVCKTQIDPRNSR